MVSPYNFCPFGSESLSTYYTGASASNFSELGSMQWSLSNRSYDVWINVLSPCYAKGVSALKEVSFRSLRKHRPTSVCAPNSGSSGQGIVR